MSVIVLIKTLKIFILASILFVWVVRYDNIIEEFKYYGLPDWLRDLVGILKISFAIMLFNSDKSIVFLGSGGITLLMMGALYTHLRVKNPVHKMLPSFTLMVFSLLIFITNF